MKTLGGKILHNRAGRAALGVFCILLAIAIVVMTLIDRNLKPIALTIAEARVRAIATDAISNAIKTCVQGVAYEDLINVTHDERGRVSMLQADSVRMNQIAADTTLTAQHFIAQIDTKLVNIPIGSIFGDPILAGRGPAIPIKIMPAGSVTSAFLTNFSTAGINQTRHEIYLQLKASMRIAIPIGAKDIEVSITVPVAESVVVGDVPQTYVDIEGLQSALPLLPDSSK